MRGMRARATVLSGIFLLLFLGVWEVAAHRPAAEEATTGYDRLLAFRGCGRAPGTFAGLSRSHRSALAPLLRRRAIDLRSTSTAKRKRAEPASS